MSDYAVCFIVAGPLNMMGEIAESDLLAWKQNSTPVSIHNALRIMIRPIGPDKVGVGSAPAINVIGEPFFPDDLRANPDVIVNLDADTNSEACQARMEYARMLKEVKAAKSGIILPTSGSSNIL